MWWCTWWDYFRQSASNPRNNQPTGGKYEPWGVASDPGKIFGQLL